MAAFGASRLFPCASAKVPQLNRHRPFSLRGGNRSSCLNAVIASSLSAGLSDPKATSINSGSFSAVITDPTNVPAATAAT